MRLLIATHGTMAAGLKSALSIIVGNVDKIDTITAYVEDVDLKKELDTYFEAHKDEEIVVCTDLFGGSVNQTIIQRLKERTFDLITGTNLAVLLELAIAINSDTCSKDTIKNAVNTAREQVMYVNDALASASDDDFD